MFSYKIQITLGLTTKEVEVKYSWVEGQEGSFNQPSLPNYVEIANDEEILETISKMIEDKYLDEI